MTFVSDEEAIKFFVNEDPRVTFAYRALKAAQGTVDEEVMRSLGFMHRGVAIGGAVFLHRFLKREGRPVLCRVTHYTVTGNLARVEIGVPGDLTRPDDEVAEAWLTQEIPLTDLFPQIAGWVTD